MSDDMSGLASISVVRNLQPARHTSIVHRLTSQTETKRSNLYVHPHIVSFMIKCHCSGY